MIEHIIIAYVTTAMTTVFITYARTAIVNRDADGVFLFDALKLAVLWPLLIPAALGWWAGLSLRWLAQRGTRGRP
ncbi:hypothetical protein [Oceanicaulis sp. MMSF_3324]|uniref:hypothetical protein n=1 Tax=Oceanicaulis sp. MMSF_3324 TaxID=3046702 RepID=UPI00273F9E09|nr:hypothetical protein [Oceanicaulis sp. MMSF_3324]